ncbi:hypothetical protein [Streptomyces albidus (ex Kaewkla and Franco 2022)]|uniref:hypothetical protein n=1 Tax=Streptomyces albidus (ex Kaewkla and Franco 2022) TaxID=722709 RepID=UPI001B355A7F|nr:hypothetical protein [Streptomyces albidus (ex Kaewkla and Franco 2022)]
MSETAQSSVKDFEDEIQATGTDENHTPIAPAKNKAADGDGITTMENHTPIAPAKDKAKPADDGDVTTLENHTPIAPPKGDGN